MSPDFEGSTAGEFLIANFGTGADASVLTNHLNIAYSQYMFEGESESFNFVEGPTSPTGPSYSHIGNNNNSSSTVEVTY